MDLLNVTSFAEFLAADDAWTMAIVITGAVYAAWLVAERLYRTL